MNKVISLAAAFMAFMLYSSFAAATGQTPEEQVRETVGVVLAALENENLNAEERRTQISDSIGKRFNFTAMGRSILALNWKKASPEQRERFVNAFRKLLENTYVVSVESYKGETVRVDKEKITERNASVDTYIVQPQREIPVTYKFKQAKDGSWYAYDVVIEGVSMISNYRSSFRSIVNRQGMDGLLAQLEKKVGTQG